MKKLIVITISIFIFLIFTARPTLADSGVVSNSAQIKRNVGEKNGEFDYRLIALRKFFKKQGSPLADYSEILIETADKYDIDWRFVPAITGVESAFGKRMPKNSYNAYGWANGTYKFGSWDESIEIVTKTLREKYYDRGAKNINQIARRYAPPSNTWAKNVRYFMAKIDPLPVEFAL